MMNINMKKVISYIGAIGAAAACMAIVAFEVINMNVPALAWFAFSTFMLTYVIAENSLRKVR